MRLPDQGVSPFRKTARFERIYQATYFRLMYFIKRMTRNEIAREDLLQETYVHLWINLEKISDDERVFPLLRTYATNIIINSLKKSAREQFRAEQFYKNLEQVTTQEEVIEIKESLERYERILEQIPVQQRTIFRLSMEEGFTYKEIAEKMNLSPDTIKYHLTQVRRTLRSQFLLLKSVMD